MAIRYFELKQAASGSSPITGDTIVMKWDDTVIPAGMTQSNTLYFLNLNPLSTWSFRSRVWDLTDLGTGSTSFDTEMISGEPWAFLSSIGPRVYVGFTFDIETTIFAQNYIDVRTDTSSVKSPRYQTNFYSASTFNEPLKVIGTDTNRYDYISINTQEDYDHITNSGLTNFDFASATPVSSTLDPSVGGGNIFAVVPYSATSAVTYFNNLYDGWITKTSDCSGNLYTQGYGVGLIYEGDMRETTESYSSIYGGPCMVPDTASLPYSGDLQTVATITGHHNVVDTWYTDCDDCKNNSVFEGIYFFSASTNCEGQSAPLVTFSSETVTQGSPFGGESLNFSPKVNGECYGGELLPPTQITASTGMLSVTDVYNSCADCTGNTSPIQYYYYFSACSNGDVYRAVTIDFDSELGTSLSLGQTVLLEEISDLPDGCYTVIADTSPYTDFNGYQNTPPSLMVNVSDCNDVQCQALVPTPTQTQTETPTPTPTVTPSTPSTTACCYSCSEYGFENTGSIIGTIQYTDCYGKNLTVNIDPSGSLFLCICDGSRIIVSDNINYQQTGVCTPSCTRGDCTSYTITNTEDVDETFEYTECFSGNSHNNTKILLTLTSGSSIVVCSCTVPVNRTGGQSTIVAGGLCQCEDAPATPTPSPTGSNTPTPEVTPTHTPSPTYSPTQTQTETPTPTPTHTSTYTPTPTYTPTYTQTHTPSSTGGVSPTPTQTQTETPTHTPTSTGGGTPTPTQTNTETPTPTPTPTTPCNRLVNPSFDIFMSDLGPCPPGCVGGDCSGTTTYNFYPEDCIPGWNTTAGSNTIEIWASGYQGVPAYEGTHFAEINADTALPQSLYQTFTAVNGSDYQVQFAHRGRTGFINTLKVGLSGSTSGLVFFPDEYTGSTSAWALNAINFTATETDYNLVFSATSSEAGGNFLDAIDVVCPQEFVTQTPTPTPSTLPPTPTPSPSSPQQCYEGSTNGTYFYIDCCGFYQSGDSVGDLVTIDTNYNYSGITVNFTPTSQNCDYGPIDYDLVISGTCDDVSGGTITILPTDGVPPFSIVNTTPGTLPNSTSYYPFEFTGLTEGNYVFTLTDSASPNQTSLISVWVDGCLDAVIDDYSGTTCSQDNGYLSVSGDSLSLPQTIELFKDSVSYATVNSVINPYDFTGLPNGEYYAFVTDFGGATAQTQTVTISGTSTLDFGLSGQSTSQCGFNTGEAGITGLTGQAPYTYLWSNGATGDTITGLSVGSYSVTVTDGNDCQLTKSITINSDNALGELATNIVAADCLTNNGQLTVSISGGTGPYLYQGSDGQSGSTSSTSFTFSNLSSGNYSVLVTDDYNCQLQIEVGIPTTGGLNSVSYNLRSDSCGNEATLTVYIQGDGTPFVYTLTGQTNGYVSTITTNSLSKQFTNLQSDTYTLTIESSTGCIYSEDIVVDLSPKFTVSASTVDDSCGNTDGSATITVGPGYALPLDYILSNGQNVLDVGLTSFTFNNLAQGTYTIRVVDADNCSIEENFVISGTSGVNLAISKVECTPTSPASLTVQVLSGLAPYTYQWSNGETTPTISNLGAGTYTVTVGDANGCSGTTSSTVLCTNQNISAYELVQVCENEFTTTYTKRSIYNMLNEGFLEVTSGFTDCVLNSAVFNYVIDFSGNTYQDSFYTGYTLNDYPSDNLWGETIEGVLSGITGISDVEVDVFNNTINITGECSTNERITIDLKIDYDVSCDVEIVIDEETEINIFFDDSGSMRSTEEPLNVMANTILRPCLLPFYGNNNALYDQRVRVRNFSEISDSYERGYKLLGAPGSSPVITKVINLVFQDEADTPYTPFSTTLGITWSNETPRTNSFNLDITSLRSILDSTSVDVRGEFFQVIRTGVSGEYFKELLESVENGEGQYTGRYGLSDKTQIHNTYNVENGGTAQYYTNLIITAINNLGYDIPLCDESPIDFTPSPTPTYTPTPTPSGQYSTVFGYVPNL